MFTAFKRAVVSFNAFLTFATGSIAIMLFPIEASLAGRLGKEGSFAITCIVAHNPLKCNVIVFLVLQHFFFVMVFKSLIFFIVEPAQ